MNAFAFLAMPMRSHKPRSTGLTMVLDKAISPSELKAILDHGSDYVDVVKMGWGTAATLSEDHVRHKCYLLRQCEVHACPGGTLFELAQLQGRYASFLDEAKRLGFSCIEISDGTVPLAPTQRAECIRRAVDSGFTVVTEVGSKSAEEDRRIGAEARVRQTLADIGAGASKVIVEARESGTLGIFDANGHINVDMLDHLVRQVGIDNLIFEAPLKAQQADLILRYGNAVNLGNIAPHEVIPLETLRLGLRGDTLKRFHGLPISS